MKKHFFFILFFAIAVPSLGQNLSLGIINDSDGYTNVRKKPDINSEIVGKINESVVFKYKPDKKSNWWWIKYNNITGYMHKSRIESVNDLQKEIDRFLKDFYKSNPNNAEYSEVNNEKLFQLTRKYTSVVATTFCEQKPEIQSFLISQYETPIHDMIDLQLIYTRIDKTEIDCKDKEKILNAIKIAGQKLGLKIK